MNKTQSLARKINSKLRAKQRNRKSVTQYHVIEKKFLESITSFRKSESLIDLEPARKILGELLSSEAQKNRDQTGKWELIISGWINPKFNRNIQIFVNQNSSKSQRIKISRFPRHDVPVRRFGRQTAGFVISVNSDTRTPNLDLSRLVCCSNGKPISFASTSVKRISSEKPFFPKSIAGTSGELCNCGVWGYIENIFTRPAGYLFQTNLWGSALVRNHPEAALQVVSETSDFKLAKKLKLEFDRLYFPAEISQKANFLAGSPGVLSGPLELHGIQRIDEINTETNYLSSVFEDVSPLEHALPGKLRMLSPSSEHIILNKAEIRFPGLVLCNGKSVIFESASDPTLPFVSGLWEQIFGSPMVYNNVLVEPPVEVQIELKEGIMLSGRNDQNWYHWIVEYLPRAMFYDSLPSEIPFLVSNRVPVQGINALKVLSSRNIVSIPQGTPALVQKLHIRRPVAQVLDTTRVQWANGLRMDIEALQLFRKKVIGDVMPSGGKYFLLRGSSHRGLINESKCSEIAQSFGYEVVNPAKMAWDEQIQLFSNASALVGAGGAVMANYLFAAKDAQIISLSSEAARGFNLPGELSRIAGADFYYLLGKSTKKKELFESKLHWMHSDFSVDLTDFKKSLEIVEQKIK